ncbi:copper chaperone for superoxide dismutase [Heterostelium album PN500]|uniref:Copper chaperone for superoxide dismutase n=1 Tax=Heterostelium pallidum (strain ATCC 26659 / Pp 5 / PN500) TaxID=670386 RepID=D3B715_HETP5|nr:copper chaperone for superoxide dismutase [Heterostelium album PN500]EFA82558.1 copper chaperone for superoxide dismutase [Heterostelium album PN500]|eukprot:XP_020434675.1 copper chaperone for superoxide dismutase [Heterostelium album PN500]
MDSLLDDDIVTEMELMVDMSCHRCVDDITEKIKSSSLKKTEITGADIGAQRLFLKSGADLAVDIIETINRTTGRNATLSGFGTKGSAVCSVGVAEGWEKGCGGAGGVGSEGVHGVIRVVEIDTTNTTTTHNNGILFEGRIGGLKPNTKHSIAIHQYGDLTNGCENVGDIYKPIAKTTTNTEFNGTSIANEDGKVEFRVLNKEYPDFWSLIGRSIVLHSMKDDGRSLDRRIACGIICRAATIGQNPKRICPCDNQPTEPMTAELKAAQDKQFQQQQQQQQSPKL